MAYCTGMAPQKSISSSFVRSLLLGFKKDYNSAFWPTEFLELEFFQRKVVFYRDLQDTLEYKASHLNQTTVLNQEGGLKELIFLQEIPL